MIVANLCNYISYSLGDKPVLVYVETNFECVFGYKQI
jgi:hypothetical protein